MLGLERSDQLIALTVEDGNLLGLGRDGAQALQALHYTGFQGADPGLQVCCFAGLAEGGIDLYLVVEGFQIAAQRQAAAEQVETLQFDPGALVFTPRVAHQVIVGRQHRQQEQHADQAELHAEAQAVHQRDGGIEQALHR